MRRSRILTGLLSAALSVTFALSGAFGGAMGTALAAENNSSSSLSRFEQEAPVSDDDPSVSKQAYSYKVRVFGGLRGTVDGGDVKTYTVKNGERFNFQQSTVAVTDSKYVYRGIRESGRDASEKLQNSSFVVTKDVDLVVVYGVAGTTVTYRVEYVDTNGNPIPGLETEEFYGNEGDEPIIAYRYAEGYEPNAYNLTGKLSSQKDNVFRFIYTPIGGSGSEASGDYEEEATTPGGGGTAEGGTAAGGTAAGGTAAATGTGGAAAGTGGAAAGGAAAGGAAAGGAAAGGAAAGGAAAGGAAAGGAAAGGEAGGGAAAGGAAAGGEAGGGNNGPAEIINIDENQAPLAEYSGEGATDQAGQGSTIGTANGGGETSQGGMSTALKVGIGAGALAVIVLLVLAILRARNGGE